MMRGVRRGCVRLRAAVVGIDDEDDSNFTITVDHKTFHFQVNLMINFITEMNLYKTINFIYQFSGT